MREEILSQLTGDLDSRTIDLLNQALRDSVATVRRAALQACGTIPLSLKAEAERLLRDSSYTTVAAALELLCKRFPEETPRYLALTKDDHGTGNQVGVLRDEISARHGDTSSVAHLVDCAGVSYDFMTRVNALEALKRLGYFDDPLFPGLMSAMANPNGRLRAPAEAVASYFMAQTRLAEKLTGYYRSHSWTPAEKKLLDPYFK
jgi:HEAT repeat protein